MSTFITLTVVDNSSSRTNSQTTQTQLHQLVANGSCVASYGLSAAGVSSDAGVFNETRALQELN
jgi:hypothetical protein